MIFPLETEINILLKSSQNLLEHFSSPIIIVKILGVHFSIWN